MTAFDQARNTLCGTIGRAVFRAALLSPALAAGLAWGQPIGPNGPGLGKAYIVNGGTLEVSGAAKVKFTGKKGDERSWVNGLCDPGTWANFQIALAEATPSKPWVEGWVAVVTEDPIGTGRTGSFALSRASLTLRYPMGDMLRVQDEYWGGATLVITTHEAAKGRRRMVGTIEGRGLEGKDEVAGKKIDFRMSFDIAMSCGVK